MCFSFFADVHEIVGVDGILPTLPQANPGINELHDADIYFLPALPFEKAGKNLPDTHLQQPIAEQAQTSPVPGTHVFADGCAAPTLSRFRPSAY